MPELSLVVPHHNHLHCLPRLLDSILAQDFKDIEIVLVDDCSYEPCLPVVEAYRTKGLTITFLPHTTPIYTMKARLEGMRAAKGNIIGFADADDLIWGTESLGRNVVLFQREQPDILHFRTARINADGSFAAWFLTMDPPAERLTGQDIFQAYVTSPNFQQQSTVWNKFFSRSVALHACDALERSRVRRFVEDACICLTTAFHAQKYVGSPHAAYGYAFSHEKMQCEEGPERATYVWYMLQELPAYFAQHGCPQFLLDALCAVLTEHLSVKVGHASTAAVRKDGRIISDATLDAMLRHTDARTFIKVLLLGNSHNTAKILGCLRTLQPRTAL
jgi:hypothetical protein